LETGRQGVHVSLNLCALGGAADGRSLHGLQRVDVDELGLLEELSAGDVLLGGLLGQEADVQALDVLLDVERILARGDSLWRALRVANFPFVITLQNYEEYRRLPNFRPPIDGIFSIKSLNYHEPYFRALESVIFEPLRLRFVVAGEQELVTRYSVTVPEKPTTYPKILLYLYIL
jgi:hypothetical protein